jgi:hypothetical protein
MRALPLLSAALLLSACLGGEASNPSTSIGDLTLTPANIRLSIAESVELTCAARDAVGGVLDPLPPVTWLVPTPTVAVLEQISTTDRSRQRLTATGVGSSTVRCRYEGFTASALINVIPFVVTATGAPALLAPGDSAVFGITMTSASGAAVPLLAPFNVVWSSSSTSVLTVVAGPTPGTALVRALAPGTATILASVRSFTDVGEVGRWTGQVQVTQPPGTD